MALTPSAIAAGRGGTKTAAPDFELKSLEGRTVRLSGLRGKVVLLNFWATWCAACRVETPWLVELDRRFRSRGLEIVGVAMDDAGEDRVTGFVKAQGIRYTIVRGNDAVARTYGGARLLPQTFFINRDGTVASSVTGLQTKRELEAAIERLLGSGTSQ